MGRPRVATLALLVGFALTSGCGGQTVKSQAFEEIDRLGATLQRGVSTKADTLMLLGQPDGSGGAIFPTAGRPTEVWYYEAMSASATSAEQKILLVYFTDELFDGYMWFSGKSAVSLR